MKICFKCNKPIDEYGENSYIMVITKRKNKILEFTCFHSDCLQEQINNVVLEEVKEKMNRCSICRKKLRFWSSYIQGENYYCKECWQKREDKLEDVREEKEKDLEKKSRKRDESIDESQKTL